MLRLFCCRTYFENLFFGKMICFPFFSSVSIKIVFFKLIFFVCDIDKRSKIDYNINGELSVESR